MNLKNLKKSSFGITIIIAVLVTAIAQIVGVRGKEMLHAVFITGLFVGYFVANTVFRQKNK